MAIARPVDRRLFFLLDRVHTLLSTNADYFLADRSGVSTSQAAVLIYLGYHNDCYLSDLAEGIGRKNSAITGLVTRMERQNLVERKHGGMDRRTKRVGLTSKGWEIREKVMDDFRDFNDSLVRGLTETEMDAVIKFFSLAPINIQKFLEMP